MFEILMLLHCVILWLIYRLYRKRSAERLALDERHLHRWSSLMAKTMNGGDDDG